MAYTRKFLLLSGGGTYGDPNYGAPPILDADFTAGSIPAGWEYSRASAATAINGGTIQSFTTNTPRFVTTPIAGLLLESASSNLIQNPRGEGGVNPGTLPTGWVNTGASQLTWTYIGAGIENGIPYTDLRVNGTYASSVTRLAFGAISAFAMPVPGVILRSCMSAFLKVVGGSYTNVTNIMLGAQPYDTSQAILGSPSQTVLSPNPPTSGSLINSRYAAVPVVNNASAVYFRPIIGITATAGAVDITIRIGCPQYETTQSATSDGKCEASAPLFPPAGTPGVTNRAADLLRVANFTSRPDFTFFQGTIVVEAQVQSLVSSISGGRGFTAGVSDGSHSNMLAVMFGLNATTNNSQGALQMTNGVATTSMGSGNPCPTPSGVLTRIVCATIGIFDGQNNGRKSLAVNGTFGSLGYIGSNNSNPIPPNCTEFTLSSPNWGGNTATAASSFSRVVRKVRYFTRYLSQEEQLYQSNDFS